MFTFINVWILSTATGKSCQEELLDDDSRHSNNNGEVTDSDDDTVQVTFEEQASDPEGDKDAQEDVKNIESAFSANPESAPSDSLSAFSASQRVKAS